jgi:hypothetical protein
MLKNALARVVDEEGLKLDTRPWRIKSPLLGGQSTRCTQTR